MTLCRRSFCRGCLGVVTLQCAAAAGCSTFGTAPEGGQPAPLQVDLRQIAVGRSRLLQCGAATIVVRHRTAEEIAVVEALEAGDLLYPQTDASRTFDVEWIVLEARCTHLGCGLIEGAGRYRGWLCPCHGSEYDPSGRVTRGPAAENLRVPRHQLLGAHMLVIHGCRG